MEIRIWFRSQGWHWRLDDADQVELWMTSTFYLPVSGARIKTILAHHIEGAEIMALTAADIKTPSPDRLPSLPLDPPPAPLPLPPAKMGPRSAAGQAQRRAERKTRRKA